MDCSQYAGRFARQISSPVDIAYAKCEAGLSPSEPRKGTEDTPWGDSRRLERPSAPQVAPPVVQHEDQEDELDEGSADGLKLVQVEEHEVHDG